MRKEILIIGGSYFLGRNFVETLLASGEYRVTVLNRGRIPIRKPEVLELVCDRHDTPRLNEVLESAAPADGRWEAIVDFCAYQPEDLNGLLPPSGAGVNQYILISTASVYADQSPIRPLDETAPLLKYPLPASEDYGGYIWGKVRTESELTKRCVQADIPYTILRPAIIYGKYNYAPRESLFFDKIINGQEILLPETTGTGMAPGSYSFVSVWDAASIILGCLGEKSCMNGCFNLAAEQSVGWDLIAQVLNRIAAGFTGRHNETAGSNLPPVKTLPAEELETKQADLPFPPDRSLLYSGSKISEMLSFTYADFAEEMLRTWKYYLLGRGMDPSVFIKEDSF